MYVYLYKYIYVCVCVEYRIYRQQKNVFPYGSVYEADSNLAATKMGRVEGQGASLDIDWPA